LCLRLLGGLVLAVTTLYCSPARRTGQGRGKEGAGLYPELAAFGISEGATPALASLVTRTSALLPSYELTRQELRQRGLRLGIKVVHRLARQLGAQVLTWRTRALLRWRAGQLPAGTELAGQRVVACVDGGRMRLRRVTRKQKGKGKAKTRRRRYRAKWREPKLLTIFVIDQRGRMLPHSRAWIDGTFGGPDRALELLAFHLHRLGAAAAEVVEFVADGAPWIWERLDWVVGRVGLEEARVERVLDWCHAVHHVGLALADLGLAEAERRRLYKKLRKHLRAGWPWQVTAELRELARGRPEESAAWTAIAYLERHAEAGHLYYARCRRRGLALGSGAIESAIRRVVNLRLKGNGITWKEENGEAALVVRAAVLTGRWEEVLEQTRASLGVDRRCQWHWQAPDMVAELKSKEEVKPPGAQTQPAQPVQENTS
jgi:hypothetical protein